MSLIFAAALFASQVAAPFAYDINLTPMEGPLDGEVEARYTPDLAVCQKIARISEDNAECFKAETSRQDVLLNRAWAQAMGRMAGGRRDALRDAERAWIVARDKRCDKEYADFAGGTIRNTVYFSCQAELRIRRTIWLEHLR